MPNFRFPLPGDYREILNQMIALAASHCVDTNHIVVERAKFDRMPIDDPTQQAVRAGGYAALSAAVLVELIPQLAEDGERVQQIRLMHGPDTAIEFLLNRAPHELPTPNGPVAPDKFQWNRRTATKIAPTPFKLLQHMWGNPKAERDDVNAAVWGGIPTADAMKSAVRKANAALESTGYPARIHPDGEYVTLE